MKSNFDELLKSVSEDIKGIKFRDVRQHGSDKATSGFGPGEEGYDPENVENKKIALNKKGFEDEESEELNTSLDLETQIKDLLMNSNDPSITEDQEEINAALQEFLGKIGYRISEIESDEEA